MITQHEMSTALLAVSAVPLKSAEVQSLLHGNTYDTFTHRSTGILRAWLDATYACHSQGEEGGAVGEGGGAGGAGGQKI